MPLPVLVRPRLLAPVAAALGVALALGSGLPAAQAADPLPGIDGEGSPRDPYQINSADDLRTVAAAINGDPGAYGGSAYRLTADVDFDGSTFGGINSFTGTLEGGGHTISDLELVRDASAGGEADRLGLIRRLEGGTVRNLTLDGVRADAGASTSGWIGAVAVVATNATLTGNAVTDAELVANSAEKVGGIAAQLHGGTIADSLVTGSLSAGEMPGGIAAYVNQNAQVRNNLVAADLTMVVPGGANGTRGNNAGLIAGYPGSPNSSTFAGNVALSGSIAYSGKVDGFVGRVIGYTEYGGWTAEDNLANDAITIDGDTVAGPGTKNQHGSDATAEELAQQATYDTLGWDFTNAWRWDDALGHPVPQYTASLFGNGSAEQPYEIGSADDLELLTAQLNDGNARYTGAKHFVLTADLDFAGREPFGGINRFEGVLDGAGHTISSLVYGTQESAGGEADRLGLVRQLAGGTIRGLTLAGVTADGGSRSGFVAGLAVVATNATLAGNTVIDAELTATSAEKVAGLVAELRGGSVTDNWVRGSVSAHKMPAGIASYTRNAVTVRNNLVEADLTVAADGGAAGTRGIDAAHVVAYPGNPSSGSSFTGNVALAGSIDYTGKVDGFAGRVIGYTGYDGWTAQDNLANAEIAVGGQTVAGPGTKNQHGTDTTPEALAQQATYAARGWDFAEKWRFDDELGHPVPKYVSPAEAPNRITTTFYGDPGTQRAFTWYSTLETDSAVAVLSTDREFPEGSATVEVVAEREDSEDGETFYRAIARDLRPGTTYYYRVGDSADQVWSATGTFVTAEGGDEDFTFVDLTDTQSQNLAEAELSAQTIAKALKHVPDAEFVMHNGDVVEDGSREQDWKDLLDSARPSLLNTTFVPASGNHDRHTNAFADHFTLEGPQDQDRSDGVYYSYTYNRAHFMVLNTNEGGSEGISKEQLDWLRADAEAARAAGAKWLVLTMHKGTYTTANHLDDEDVMAMRRTLVPVIDELDIDLVLQGHDHVMSRSKVLAADPDGVEGARPVETTKITEVRNGKRVEYAVDPEGTIYFLPNTAGAKHYRQATSPQGVDLEPYLRLFDRTGEQATENFTAVDVTAGRLTVNVYDVRDRGVPRLFEGFGIDRELSPVGARIDELPAVDDVTLDDAEAVAAVRAAVDGLTEAQRGALTGLPRLEAAEQRLRELGGLVSTDGKTVAWADPDATARQAVTVRNDTRSDFTGTPVQLRIPSAPDVERDELSFFGSDGVPLPFEVETWQAGGTSTVWVRVPRLAAGSAQQVWAYFGGGASGNDPTAVWGEDYTLVEHFGAATASGERRTDSTGRHSGLVVGDDLATGTSERGTGQARFAGSRLQYPDDVGGHHDRIAISGVYSLTEEDLAELGSPAPVIAKESATGDGKLSFWQGVRPDESQVGTRLAGNSFEFGDVDLSHRFGFPADGEPHLVTQTYDGMTYSVFVDGREVHSQMVEYRSTFSDPAVETTIGDYHTNDGSLRSPFRGLVDEVQIAGVAFTPDFEAFRFANLFGDAVTFGERVERADEPVTLMVGTPHAGSTLEAGLVEVTGSVTRSAVLTAQVAGKKVHTQRVDAGPFSVRVPVNEPGEQTLTVTAAAVGGPRDTAEPVEVPVVVEDTVAPAAPEVSDDAESASDAGVTLSATPRTKDRERVEATFYAGPTIPLDDSNVVVRSGSTPDRVPDALTPASGKAGDELVPTTVGEDENPFQVYEISLTGEQAAQDEFHLTWSGAGDARTVSAHVYDHAAGRWLLKGSGSDPDGAAVALDVTARADENVVADGKLHLLVWRGLTALPDGEDRDIEALPTADRYDWAFDHVPDSQLYAQATPDLMTHQFEYVAEVAEERKTELVVQAGDWVNREYLSQEYQWVNAEPSALAMEEAGLPYLISWGNHDYQNNRNGRVMLPKYFPMERFEKSLEGSPWRFGGSDNIDNYYYTAEIDGAQLLLLTVGFFSADNADDPGLAWARDVIEAHPDHSVILANHNSVNQGVNGWSNAHVTRELVDPHPNVKLVLGGHIAGTGVASRETAGGNRAYGVLTDYQSRVYGGQEYLKHISVDAENDLLYFNTWSPLLEKATSDGNWHHEVPEGAIPGFHGDDTENFALEIDLGGSTTRTLAAESLTVAAGPREQVGDPQTAVGAEAMSVQLDGADGGVQHEWYVELRDQAGHVTRSAVSTFTLPEGPVAPAWDPDAVYTAGDEVTHRGALWQASWWSRNQEPGNPHGPWQEIATTDDGTAVWTPTRIFDAGDVVEHDGRRYEATWWTRNQEPGSPFGPWR
jgi:predicted phosphodiesterase